MTTTTKQDRNPRLAILALSLAAINGIFGLLRDVRTPTLIAGVVLSFALVYGLGRAKQSGSSAYRPVLLGLLAASIAGTIALFGWILFGSG